MVVLGLVLDAAWESSTGLVVWAAGAIMALGCVFEVCRMRRIVPARLCLPLGLGFLAALAPGLLHYFGDGRVDLESLGLGSFFSARSVLASFLLGAVATSVGALLFARREAKPGMTLFLSLWLFAPLPSIYLIWSAFGPQGLLALVLLSKIGDVFGYYVGNAIGKSHPFPGISPGKTTAGCVASLIAGTLAGGACVWFELLPGGRSMIVEGLVAGALINVAAQAGDLLESKLKRKAAVKDSGPWFGPSGGFLDLVDSLLLSIPAALLTWPWLFA